MQVQRAVTLLWVSLVLGAIVVLVDIDSILFGEMEGFMWWFPAAVLVTYALLGALIVFVSRRHNWARILLLVLTVMGTILVLVPWPGIDDNYWTISNATSEIGFLVLDGVALLWLFTGEGGAWFARS